MIKLTTPKAILIGSFMIAIAVLFRIDGTVIKEARAEVAGMSYSDLRRDRDFRKAVEYIVDDCSISGGYVDDGYLYGIEISC